jgi:hypothetical protein
VAGPAAQHLLATARDAFTHALQVTSAIAAIAAAAAAVLAGVMLWRVQLPPDHETPVVLGDAPAVAAPASELAR